MTQRIDAAQRIQKNWRGCVARGTTLDKAADRQAERDDIFLAADRNEAALLIQNRARIIAAKNRVGGIREARAALALQLSAVAATYVHPDALEPELFYFGQGVPDDDELIALFDAIDVTSSGTIPRSHCRAVFDRLTMSLHPGDPQAAFDRAMPTNAERVTLSALTMVIIRAVAL
jgi:hypothetical protein